MPLYMRWPFSCSQSEPLAQLPASPSCPAEWGSSVVTRPRAGSGGRLYPGNADFPSEIPSFLGVQAFPGHPQPIWVLLRDRLGWLSPSHYQQGTHGHMCVTMWVHNPGFCSQAAASLETLAL